MSEFILGLDALAELTKEVMSLLPNGGVVILRGDLAAGKTTFVSALQKSLDSKMRLHLQLFRFNSAMVKTFFIMIFITTV